MRFEAHRPTGEVGDSLRRPGRRPRLTAPVRTALVLAIVATILGCTLVTHSLASSGSARPADRGPAPARTVRSRATSPYVSVPAPGPQNVTPTSVPPTSPSAPDVSYGPNSWEKLDVYRPDARQYPGARPVIIWLHSGGWISGSRADVAAVVRRQIGRGFAVVSVDYALAPAHRFPAPLHDVKLAIRWVKANAVRFGFDPSAFVLAGGSSGGQLATLAAVTPGRFEPGTIPSALRAYDDRVAAVVDFVGPTDLYAFDHETHNGAVGAWARSLAAATLGCENPAPPAPIACAPGIERAASVAPYLSRESPPVFMAYGALDSLVPPREQELPTARAWASFTGAGTVWVEVLAHSGHNVSVDTLNNAYFDRFLDGVVAGSIR